MPHLTTRLAAFAMALALAVAPLAAQQAGPPEPIKDNSFLVEEAYNQDPGVVQHINTFSRARGSGDWAYSFTQEWPVGSMRHQLSFSVPVLRVTTGDGRTSGIGDVALNYRYQLVGLSGGPVAVAPRVTVLLSTGDATRSLGSGGAGVQVSVPVSIELSERVVTHINAGATFTPRARDATGDAASTTSFNLGQSVIWLATPAMNLMLEAVWNSTATVAGADRVDRSQSLLVSPGVRWAYNLAHGLQVVPGLAYPIGVGPSRGNNALYTYLSFEHPF